MECILFKILIILNVIMCGYEFFKNAIFFFFLSITRIVNIQFYMYTVLQIISNGRKVIMLYSYY